VLLGEVVGVRGRRVLVAPRGPVVPGDGIVFAGDREQGTEQGGRVYEVVSRGSDVELVFAHDAIDVSRLVPGQQIWKTDDPQLTARLRKSFTGSKPLRRVGLDLEVTAAIGQTLRITGRADNGATCALESPDVLAAATKHPLTGDVLREQLGRLGGTVFELRKFTARIDGGPMVPLSVLGKLRHAMVAELDASAQVGPRRAVRSRDEAGLMEPPREDAGDSSSSSPVLRVLCRTLGQLETVIACEVGSVMVEFSDVREYRQAVELAGAAGVEVYLATPRIQKPDEMGIFHAMAKHGASGWLVRNLAGAAFCRERSIPFVADFSLNAANQWTVDFFRSLGAERVTVSYDLNRDQLLELVDAVPPRWLEVVIHQHMPMFHMEHCVFCAVLSPGTDKTNCGRPCDVHQVRMRDRIGMEHVLVADVGCRNTLYNAVPQSAAEAASQLLARGIRDFRVELLSDADAEISTLVGLYRDLLAGHVSGSHVWQRLKASNRVGVTRGTLEERRNPLAIL
jgi:putative protease